MLAASWSAFERAGMLQAATWHDSVGVPVTSVVMLDAPGTVILADVLSSDYSVLYRVSLWPGVRPQDRIDVGATQYRVREVLPVSDGALARATLVRLD
jgi:hypothetical protein